MAGHRFTFNGGVGFIDYADGYGEARIGNRTYRWEFHEYTGPTFLRKDGEVLKRVPSERHPVWNAFGKWLKRWRRCHHHPLRDAKLTPLAIK